MTDDFSAISGEEGAYVPCNEVALAFPASLQDTSAIYGEDEGFVAANTTALADEADATDTSAAFGRSAGLVPGPCEECDDFEEFDGTEAIGWGSNTDDVWARTGNGTSSVSGGFGRMDLVVASSVGPPPVSTRQVIMRTDPTTIRTELSWIMSTRFSVLNVVTAGADAETLLSFRVFHSGTGDSTVVTLERSTTNATGLADIQVQENGVTIYHPGLLATPITFDADGATNDLRWVFTVGGTQEIYLNGALILSGPAFTVTLPQLGSLVLEVNGLMVKSGAFAGSSTTTILVDYIRFCE